MHVIAGKCKNIILSIFMHSLKLELMNEWINICICFIHYLFRYTYMSICVYICVCAHVCVYIYTYFRDWWYPYLRKIEPNIEVWVEKRHCEFWRNLFHGIATDQSSCYFVQLACCPHWGNFLLYIYAILTGMMVMKQRCYSLLHSLSWALNWRFYIKIDMLVHSEKISLLHPPSSISHRPLLKLLSLGCWILWTYPLIFISFICSFSSFIQFVLLLEKCSQL